MVSFYTSFVIVFFAFYLGGCGQNKTKDDSTSTIYLKPDEDISNYTQDLILDSKTPSGVGTLFVLRNGVYDMKNLGLCTWFLVDTNLAMTNSHCIPDELKNNTQTDCGSYLQGKIKINRGVEELKCKRILSYSDFSGKAIENDDYALIELNKSVANSSYYKLDRKGLTDNVKVKILTMTHFKRESGIYSEFRELQCVIKSSDFLGVIETLGSSPLTAFLEEGSNDFCKAEPGNSGSPVLDYSYRLVGIVHGGLKKGSTLNINLRNTKNSVTDNIVTLTNLRCQKFSEPKLDADWPDSCREERKRNKFNEEKLLKEIQPKVIKLFLEAYLSQPSFLEYKTEKTKQGDGSNFTFVPNCIKPFNKWHENDLSKISISGLFRNKKSIQTQLINYFQDFILNIDYYGNYSLDISFKPSGVQILKISNLENIDEGNDVDYFAELKHLNFRVSRKIPVCKTKNESK